MADDIPHKKYILVAEDDKFYANIYRSKLALEGFEVNVVGDGQQALDSIKERRPDLILLDLIMPVKDGFETLRDLKKNPDTQNIPIVVLSSLGQEEDAQRAKELGADDYFTKGNISIEETMEKIRARLG